MSADSLLVIVMCKAPRIGGVKTRLMPDYSAKQACCLHQQMAITVIERAKRLFTDVWIATDEPEHAFFARFDVPVYAQGHGHLGQRMTYMLEQAHLHGFTQVLLLGSDSPHMAEQRLKQASLGLRRYDVVLGPVEDGGYDLIALSVQKSAVFDNIDWGSDKVLQQSLAVIKHQGWRFLLLPEGFDVDFSADVQRAQKEGWVAPIL